MKKAVVLFNLGGPDNLDNVEPFLFNLFNDPAIISLRSIFRYPLAKLISKRRTPIAKNIYKQMGGLSPILKLTQEQALQLEKSLNLKQNKVNYKTFIAMRCWKPRASETINKIKEFNPNEVILLPMYPQFSYSTSGSSINEWKVVCKKNNFKIKTSIICCYPTDSNFIDAHIDKIKNEIGKNNNEKLIFSAHGLPEKNIRNGDPYQWQIEQTVKKIVEKININNLDYVLSYQSRVGPLKWIGPSTDEIIIENSNLGKSIILVPVAFVSEHSETLVELDIEYKKLANENGCKNYSRVAALGVSKYFIDSLSNVVLNKESYKFKEDLYAPKVQCPSNFKKCLCQNEI